MNTPEHETQQHEQLQDRMIAVARRMLESKRQLQEEVREDMKRPDIRAAIDELKKPNAERTSQRV